MAEPRDFNCESCKTPGTTQRRNTKYCAICRLLIDLKYVKALTRNCWLCQNAFAPLTFKTDPAGELCGDCDDLHRKAHAEGLCFVCQLHKDNLLHRDVDVCVQCALDPEARPRFINHLQDRHDDRLAAANAQYVAELRARAGAAA